MLHRISTLLGSTIRARDGDVGRLGDLYFDDRSWLVRYLVVDAGTWLFGRHVLISPDEVGMPYWGERIITVKLTREQVENSPDVDIHQPVSRQQLSELHEYYTWPIYWTGPAVAGTAPLGPYPATSTAAAAGEQATDVEPPTPEEEEDLHLRSVKEVTGYGIHAKDGEIGHADDFILDDSDWFIRYVVVDTGRWLPGRKVLVAPEWIESIAWLERMIAVKLSRRQVEESPDYDPDSPVAPDYEDRLHRHYGQRG